MQLTPTADTRLCLAPERIAALATEFGTPLYVLDEAHLRARVRRQVAAWPWGEVSFASKANSTLAVLQVAHQEGCAIDVASEGELRAALAAGVPAERCRLHGNAKTRAELEFALAAGIGKVIADNTEELGLLGELGARCPVLLRLAPAVTPKTHAKISTGQADTKFGFPLGEAMGALSAALAAGLAVEGFHCHVGSQLLEPGAQVEGAVAIAEFALRALGEIGFEARVLNLGGGLGVRYLPDHEPLAVEEYAARLAGAVQSALGGRLTPRLDQEPGRSMVAESGVTVYRVQTVKTAGSGRTFVSVDGGLSDNPRPALYGSRYDVRFNSNGPPEPTRPVTVSGKHCETDTLFEDVPAPESLKAGDFVQVLVTGAYNSSMASQYNRYPRPATVMLREDGRACLVQERDRWDAMFARERLLGGD